MKFRDYFSLKHIVFAIVIFALLIPIASWDSGRQVKVTFDDASVSVVSKKYNMSVRYDEIASAELTALADPGDEGEDAFDDDIRRVGWWSNEVWGTYFIVADLDTSNCIVLHLTDGQTYVFSCKDDETTASLYSQLQAHLN